MGLRMQKRFGLLLSILLLSAGDAASYTGKADPHYNMYSNVSMTQIGYWKGTGVHVPRGAVVGVIADGEMWTQHGSNRWGPASLLKVRVGEKGSLRGLSKYYDSTHVRVFRSATEGELQYEIKPKSRSGAASMRGKINTTLMVWEKENLDRVFSDVNDLIDANPGSKRYPALLLSLAECYTDIGEYSKSEGVLERLRDRLGRRGREAALAFLYSSKNEKWLGRYDRMKTYAEEALEISTREGHKGIQVESLLLIIQALAYVGQTEEALNLAIRSPQLNGQMKFESDNSAARADMTLGMLYLGVQKAPESLRHCQKAVDFFAKSRKWGPLAQSYDFLGQAQQRLGLRDAAVKSFESAIEVAVSIGRSETLWRAHSQLGRINEREGALDQALVHYAEAIKVIEAMRVGLEDPSHRTVFMSDKLYVYEWMIGLLHRMKRDEEAFHYLERAKARLVLDMLRGKIFSSRNKEISELLVRERNLREQILELQQEEGLERALETGEEDESFSERSPRENLELERLRSEQRLVLQRLSDLNPDLASLVTVNPLTARQVQALLDDDTGLLAYLISSEMNVVFLLTKRNVTGVLVEASRREIEEGVKTFRVAAAESLSPKLLTSKDYEKPMAELYEILIKPVEGEIAGKKRLVVVPHGMLHYLPFQALRDQQGRYLIESFSLSYLPSASVLKYARDKNAENRAALLAVGNPITDLAALPAADKEAREVSTLFDKPRVLTGLSATETAVKSEGPRYDLLLFSTHGEMIESNPLKSNLRFTSTLQDDGKLTVSEIFDMEVKANLVTLSACETGLARGTKGDLPQGDDLVGLSRAFIHAGAPSVIASLWKVSDDSTVAIMSSFYRNLRTMSKAEALQKAQLELVASKDSIYNHPYFWAPFVLVGDWK